MTKQQSKALLIVGGLVIGSYVVRSVVTCAMQMAYMQQQQARARQQAQAKAKQKAASPKKTEEKPKPKVTTPPPKPKPPAPSPYAGVWTGRTAIDGRGTCVLRLEIADKQGEPNHFTGFSSMVCNHAGPLVAKSAMSNKALALNRMDPEAAVLTGTLGKDAVELTAEKTVGATLRAARPPPSASLRSVRASLPPNGKRPPAPAGI